MKQYLSSDGGQRKSRVTPIWESSKNPCDSGCARCRSNGRPHVVLVIHSSQALPRCVPATRLPHSIDQEQRIVISKVHRDLPLNKVFLVFGITGHRDPMPTCERACPPTISPTRHTELAARQYSSQAAPDTWWTGAARAIPIQPRN
jgi:hypothetical protein